MNIINCVLLIINWTAISAIATFGMAIATFVTLRQNGKQLKEIKRQWDEDNRPILEINLVNPPFSLDSMDLYFEILNIGKGVAKNISISFDESIKNIPLNSIYENAKRIKNKTYNLLPNKSIFVPFISFSYDSSNKYKLIFNRSIYSDQYKLLEEYLKKNSIDVKCEYDGISNYTKECSFSYFDISKPNITIETLLSQISIDISKIKDTLQNQNHNFKYTH